MTSPPRETDDMLHDEQLRQEDEYDLPYHHLSAFSPGFRTGFADAWAMNYNHTIEFVLDQLESYTPDSILDIGCGDGRITREVRTRFSAAHSVGIDYSERAIEFASLMDPGGTYLVADIGGDTLDRVFDFGLLVEVFEHIPQNASERFVRGIARAIGSGGMLLVTVPHVNKPVEYKHFRHFTAASLAECFADSFEPERTFFIEKMGLVNALLNRLVVNPLFVLNNGWALDRVYRAYGKWVFRASAEDECARVAILFRRRGGES